MMFVEKEFKTSILISIRDVMRRKHISAAQLRDIIDPDIEDMEFASLMRGSVVGFSVDELDAILKAVDEWKPST